MTAQIVIDVYLNPKKDTEKPGDGAILFSYVLDKYVPNNLQRRGKVKVTRNGDVYVGDIETDDVAITFVLQTKKLAWKSDAYKVTFDPNQTLNHTTQDMMWIARTGEKPTGPWVLQDEAFGGFSKSTTILEAIEISANRQKFGRTKDFPYGLAVNVIGETDGLKTLVRDDPLIKDRGVPAESLYKFYLAVGAGFLGIAILVLLTR